VPAKRPALETLLLSVCLVRRPGVWEDVRLDFRDFVFTFRGRLASQQTPAATGMPRHNIIAVGPAPLPQLGLHLDCPCYVCTHVQNGLRAARAPAAHRKQLAADKRAGCTSSALTQLAAPLPFQLGLTFAADEDMPSSGPFQLELESVRAGAYKLNPSAAERKAFAGT
jgi:hypothetical protein